jgi:hypothetical protein
VKEKHYFLIRLRLRALAHDKLHLIQPAHLLMYLLQHLRPLLQPKHDIFLHERELHIGRQGLQVRQLLIRLRQQRLLVFLPS